MKRFLQRFCIEGAHGMACGIFATLIMGMFLRQIANLFPSDFNSTLIHLSGIATGLTGIGIGVGVACQLQEAPLVVLCAGIAGMLGGDAAGPSAFLCSFLAAFTAIELSRLFVKKTRFDLFLCPLTGFLCGELINLLLETPLSYFIQEFGNCVNWGAQQQPLLMGIIVAVLMSIAVVFPIGTAALGVIAGLSGPAAGAATIGCCCSMVGMAVASYRENGFSGLLSIGTGTPLLLLPNILKNPFLLLPPILSSAILGPLGVLLGKMQNSPNGSGLGTMGLMGQTTTWETMTAGEAPQMVFLKILLFHFILPGVLTLFIANGMRKLNLIKSQDMLLHTT